MKPSENNHSPVLFGDDSPNRFYFIFSLSVCLVEFILLFSRVPLSLLLAVHFVIILFLAGIFLYALKSAWDLRFLILLTLGITLFGPFGSIAFFCCLLFYAVYKRVWTPF